jgi:putative endonuclease
MSKQTGNDGEQAATHYLTKQGYDVLATNWHCSRGELDIIARQDEVLVFIEVKTRRGNQPDAAFAGVSAAKCQRLIASAYIYLQQNGLDDVQWRIDIIAVALPRTGNPVIAHVEDALDW